MSRITSSDVAQWGLRDRGARMRQLMLGTDLLWETCLNAIEATADGN